MLRAKPRPPAPPRQRGAVIITMALVMLLLLGFIGAALDFGRLFVIRTELQTAMDSCALSAAQELDGQANAIARAINAGRNAGNLNRVDFQSASWGGLGQVADAEITFRAADYGTTASDTLAKYVQCQHTQTGAPTWLLQALGGFSGDAATYPNVRNVTASAVATRGHAQTTCPIPVAIRPKEGGTSPNYGYTVGEWVTVLTQQSAIPGGYIGWANLDGTNSAANTRAQMEGYCGVRVDDDLGTPGVQTTIAEPWNARFGIYRRLPDFSVDPIHMRPDFTGYSYSVTNWPSQFNAYDGTGPVPNFVAQRAANAACSPNGRIRGAGGCEAISNVSLNSFQDLAASGNGTSSHGSWGTSRRLVMVPVTGTGTTVDDFVCMLMLQPLSIPMADVQLEFRGNASDPNSPCATPGLPGGVAGPLVPVLVR